MMQVCDDASMATSTYACRKLQIPKTAGVTPMAFANFMQTDFHHFESAMILVGWQLHRTD